MFVPYIPVTKIEKNVNSISLISDKENKTRNFTEEIFGITEENAGVAMIRCRIANENAGIAKEKNVLPGLPMEVPESPRNTGRPS